MWVEERPGDAEASGDRTFRRAGDLSRGGLKLEQTIPLPLGTMVHLTFTLPGDSASVEVRGEIVSNATADDLRMGVKFVDVSDAARERIDAFLRRSGTSDDDG